MLLSSYFYLISLTVLFLKLLKIKLTKCVISHAKITITKEIVHIKVIKCQN